MIRICWPLAQLRYGVLYANFRYEKNLNSGGQQSSLILKTLTNEQNELVLKKVFDYIRKSERFLIVQCTFR
jgi:hypothetical protein